MFTRNLARLLMAYSELHAGKQEKIDFIAYCALMVRTAKKHDKDKPKPYDK